MVRHKSGNSVPLQSNQSNSFSHSGSFGHYSPIFAKPPPGPLSTTRVTTTAALSTASSGSARPGGPPNPVPPNAGRCHHIHAYSAAQHDPKIKDIRLSHGPAETWNVGRDHAVALHQFLHTIKPLTTLLEGVFNVTSPDNYEIYRQVYSKLPKNDANKGLKDCLGIWTSRSIVLNTTTDIHLDLKDVCKGFCAVVPLGNFNGGNFCLPRLGISIPVAPGIFPHPFSTYLIVHYLTFPPFK